MSGTIARPAPDGAPGGSPSEPVAPPGPRAGWRAPVNLAIAICTLLALGLRLLLLSRPGYLLGVTEYDDGPYFGSAVMLVHGLLPYKEFILVQPPGITLLMVPSALLSKITGTATAMASGRVLTTLASTAGVALTGLLVRHRGLVVVIVTCGIIAVYPDSVYTARTILVEPWLVLFCLLGALALFDGDRLTSSRKRLFWGGAAFGFAGCVEVWAIFPVIVLGCMLLPRLRRLAVFAGGLAAGFLVPTLPFAALAPKRFYDSLYVAQVAPRAGSARVPLGVRLSNMMGVINLHLGAHPRVLIEVLTVVLIVAVALVIAAAWLLSRRPPPQLDWFALVTTSVVVVMFLWPDQFHYHFAAFLAPFFALSIALPVGRLLDVLGTGTSWLPEQRASELWKPATALASLAIVLLAMAQGSHEAHLQLPLGTVPARVDRIVPKGACVGSDQVSYLLMANRFSPVQANCPHMLDGLGSDLAFSNGLKPSTGAGNVKVVQALWWDEFTKARFIWLSYNSYRRVAWYPALRAYFKDNFVLVFQHGGHDSLYARKATP
ncbi:MAG TPA: glycosyltransferase family 87 protein [Streptosporangiaceae bacterium]|nr:glycosyltransferase family 87 protein [Streptosporangiaceae bacterium]